MEEDGRMPPVDDSAWKANATAIVGSLTALLLVFACAGHVGYVGPVNEWWEERGPVVRHETFPADCTLCHQAGSWDQLREDFTFDHLAQTGVPLEGAHTRAECLRCHNDRGPVQLFAQRGCSGCHEDIHRGLLGKNCVSCHEQDDWLVREAIALHNRTRFPLVGVHAATACWRCHPGAFVGEFVRVDVDCARCHAEDLARATVPDHLANGWVQGCERCHIPTQWQGAGFNHAGFPLTGAHQAASCESCHSGGVYAGTPRQCVACHQAEYNSAPNHVAANFPTACEQCHSTVAWEPANFNHSFPIAGPHNRPCIDCHTTGTYPTFSCTHCHEHDQPTMNEHHSEVPGYVWSSPACLACHPAGHH